MDNLKNKVLLGDCLELMMDIPNERIDMILCDLPYGTTNCKWDSIIPFKPLWEQYERIIKPNGAIVLFGSEPFSSALRMSNITMYKYDWKWLKNRYGNFIMASRQPIKEQEDICVFSFASSSTTGKVKMIYNPQYTGEQKNKNQKHKENNRDKSTKTSEDYRLKRNINKGAFPKNVLTFDFDKDRLHPTQKPLDLIEYLVKTYTNENDLVLDNCAGSGTTGIACLNTNRNYILIEKEQKYFDIINTRIEKHKLL